jgi:hypothetical protein
MHVFFLRLCIVSFTFEVDCVSSAIGYVALYLARKHEELKLIIIISSSSSSSSS